MQLAFLVLALLVGAAIPDQDLERLQRLDGGIATYLTNSSECQSRIPVTDYTASVTAFKVGELDMVWYGGLKGVQARLQGPGGHAVVQRDIDEQFHCVVIVSKKSGITDPAGLKGHTFTFGSESSTSGRLMPWSFLARARIKLEDFKGQNGFSCPLRQACVRLRSTPSNLLREAAHARRSAIRRDP
jgi:phosphonate transport system substrate-binding protein